MPAIANQREGQQAHFGLELTLHIVDDGGAIGFGRVADGERIHAGRAGRGTG